MAHDTQHLEPMAPHVKTVANWLAAALGIGTFAGMVNVLVGVLSGAWIAMQLYGYLRYDLPVKRARFRALSLGDPVDMTDREDF